jgi:hypothetical protein
MNSQINITETMERNQKLELQLSTMQNLQENLDIKNKAIYSMLDKLPVSFIVNYCKKRKILKVNFVTNKRTEVKE